MSFTKDDKALVLRAARIIREQAETIKRSHAPWTAEDGKRQKRRYDRFLREERDLRELVKRTPIEVAV